MENVTEWLDEDYVTTSYWLHDNRTAATRLSYPVVDDPLASTTVTTTASAAAAAATEDYLPDWIDLFLAVCFSTLIVITIVGNTLVIAAVITTRRLRSVTNCFVSSLAAADLLVGLAVMPPAVMLQLNGGTWELGEVLCDSWVSLDVLLCTASILSLCAISIDRYLAVTQPLIYSRRRRSKRLAGLMIVVVWIMAGAITSPPLLGCFPRARNSLELDKKCSYNMDSSYVVFSAVGSFFLPLMVMLYVYGRISCVIAKRHRSLETTDHAVSTGDCHKNSKHNREDLPRMHRRSVRRTSHAAQPSESRAAKSSAKLTTPRSILSSRLSTASVSEGTASDVGPNNNKSPVLTCTSLSTTATTTLTTTTTTTLMVPEPTVGEATSSSPSRKLTRIGTMRVGHQHSCINRVTRETKTAGTLAVVVGGFVACWLPFFILYLATPFMPVEPPDPLMPALTWLGWLNSAMNPFIYAFYSADFRTAFWRLTCRKCSRSRLDTNPAYYQGAASAALPSWRRQTSRT